jgi:hypothetical protein
MASESEEIKKIKKQLEDLKKSFGKDLQDSIDTIIKRLSSGSANLNEWKTQLTLFQTQADKVSESLDYVSRSLSDSVNELKRGDEFLRKQVNSTRKLSSIADQLLSVRKGEASFDKKKINNLKDQVKLHIQTLQSLKAQYGADSDRAKALQADINAAMDLNEGFEGIEETASNINKKLGILPQAAKGIDKAFGKLGLGNLGIADAVDETHRLGQEAAMVGDKGFKPMSNFIGSIKDKLGESFNFTNLIQLSLLNLIDALSVTDNGAGDLAKSFNITYSEALNVRRELGNIAVTSMDAALNTKNLQETLTFVGAQLGSNAKLNEADLKTFTKLREQAGYTNEELYGIQQLSLVNNKTLEDNTKEILGGAKAYASRNKLVINEKQVLRDVSKASASIKLSLGGSAEAVAEAAVKARQFGVSLEQAEKISQSLLNFESSIENELSAELLLGKDLSFEKARQLALNNDIAGATEEIAKQVGTSADFANMNAIQQEAIAKAAGMTRDELAQSLMDREALTKLSGVEGANAQERFNNLVKEVGMEEAKKRLGDEQLANQFEQQSVQERFNQTVEKLKEIFVNLAGPILQIVSPIADLVGYLSSILGYVIDWGKYLLIPYGILQGIAAISKIILGTQISQNAAAAVELATEEGKFSFKQLNLALENETLAVKIAAYMVALKDNAVSLIGNTIAKAGKAIAKSELITNIGIAAMSAIKSLSSIPIVGWALGLAAAGTVAALGYSFLKGDDVMSPGEGSSGYGKRTLFGPEGAIQLNNKDTVIAGTNLFDKADDMVSAPKGALSVSNSTSPKKETPMDPNSGTNARLDALITATTKVNSISTLKIQ